MVTMEARWESSITLDPVKEVFWSTFPPFFGNVGKSPSLALNPPSQIW